MRLKILIKGGVKSSGDEGAMRAPCKGAYAACSSAISYVMAKSPAECSVSLAPPRSRYGDFLAPCAPGSSLSLFRLLVTSPNALADRGRILRIRLHKGRLSATLNVGRVNIPGCRQFRTLM